MQNPCGAWHESSVLAFLAVAYKWPKRGCGDDSVDIGTCYTSLKTCLHKNLGQVALDIWMDRDRGIAFWGLLVASLALDSVKDTVSGNKAEIDSTGCPEFHGFWMCAYGHNHSHTHQAHICTNKDVNKENLKNWKDGSCVPSYFINCNYPVAIKCPCSLALVAVWLLRTLFCILHSFLRRILQYPGWMKPLSGEDISSIQNTNVSF